MGTRFEETPKTVPIFFCLLKLIYEEESSDKSISSSSAFVDIPVVMTG